MDIVIDFTSGEHLTVEQLSKYPYLRSITFVFKFFTQLNKSFQCLYEYVKYLNDKPLVKIFIKPKNQQMKPKYNVVALGGTFDHLHIGHQMLLLYSALICQKKLIIGVTSDQMLSKKVNKQLMQSLLIRMNQVKQFIKTFKNNLQIQIVKLNDPYGPTIQQQNVDAVVVSEQTYKGGVEINIKRKQKQWKQLEIQICPIMAPISHLTSIQMIQNKISSTRIRSHILNKNGFTVERYLDYENQYFKLIAQIKQLMSIKQASQNNQILLQRKWFDIIIKYYSQYWRYFHTNHHIAKMLRDLHNVEQIYGQYEKLYLIDKIALKISIVFHDIIYRPDIQNNEQQSVKFSQSFINQILAHYIKNNDKSQELKKSLVNKVSSSILCTKHHNPQSNNMIQQILCQLDMSVLDEHQLQKYQTYAFNIQKQYRPLYHQKYPKNRLEFLNKIINKKYQFKWRKGDNVERNIKWEINYWQQKGLKKE